MRIRGRNGDCGDEGVTQRVRLLIVVGEVEEERVATHVG